MALQFWGQLGGEHHLFIITKYVQQLPPFTNVVKGGSIIRFTDFNFYTATSKGT